MPWRETSAMEERIRFVKDYRSGVFEMSELCGRYGISRKTGYKWIQRFEEEGAAGLADRSRAPHRCEHRMSEAVREALLAVRLPASELGTEEAPRLARSTPARGRLAGGEQRGRAASARGAGERATPASGGASRTRGRRSLQPRVPNDLWTADFKGHFRTRDWDWCYPLTLLDHVSRKCLGLKALDTTDGDGVRPVFERAFREAGLPLAILTDNGPPFVAPRGLRGWSALSVWWIRLGIRPLRTDAREPRAERRPRALPPHAEGGDRDAGRRQPHRAAATLRPLPGDRQGRAPARGPWSAFGSPAGTDMRMRTGQAGGALPPGPPV